MILNEYPEINIVVTPMPMSIKAFTCRVNEYYTVIVNENLADEEKRNKVQHELDHIKNGDFDSNDSVNDIELRAHALGA